MDSTGVQTPDLIPLCGTKDLRAGILESTGLQKSQTLALPAKRRAATRASLGRPRASNGERRGEKRKMRTQSYRILKILGLLAGTVALLKVYLAQEWLAALILFTAAFASLAAMVGAVYLFYRAGRDFERESRRAFAYLAAVSRKPFRRPQSDPVQ